MADEGIVRAGIAPAGPKIRSVLAPNPSMMTESGTNTYIVGSGEVAVIDPGPAIGAHQDAILSSLRPGEVISHIFVTHSHLDHSGLAPALAQATGAPVHAFGAAGSGRSAMMTQLADQIGLAGGEGIDHSFAPDVRLADGDSVAAKTWRIKALHTPGHLGNHLCFACGNAVFTGDHVMAWSTSLISPPDGDMTDYMASLTRLAQGQWHVFWPGHGREITEPAKRIAELRAHRLARERAVLQVLAARPARIHDLTGVIYADLAAQLIPAARRNLLAHLVDLTQRKIVTASPRPGPDAVFALA